MSKSSRPKHRGNSRKRKISCAKCRKKFRVRKYAPVPHTCNRVACRTWADEERKIRESVARLSAPEMSLMGVDMARKISKSMALGMSYGMVAPKLRNLIQASNPQINAKALAKLRDKTAKCFSEEMKARVKNIQMLAHDEIVFEIEADNPIEGTAIDCKVTV